MASERTPGNAPGNNTKSQNRKNTRDGQNETKTKTDTTPNPGSQPPTPGQRQSKPRPGRRPQRDSQGNPQRPRTGRSGTGPSAPQQPHGGRSGRPSSSHELGEGVLRVVPLGGMGEIGKSMMAVEYGNDLIVIDAGGKFPEEWERGIDLIIPDIRYVRDRLSKFRAS